MRNSEKEELAYIVNYKPSWFVRWGLLLITAFMFVSVAILIYAKDTMKIKFSAIVIHTSEKLICVEYQSDRKIIEQALLTGKISLITQNKIAHPVDSANGSCFYLVSKRGDRDNSIKNGEAVEIQIESRIISFINKFGIY